SDLLDRAIIVSLPCIPDEARRPESEVLQSLEAGRAAMLGGLLDGVACALRNLPATRLTRLPRMADFARWATAAEEGIGFERGAFMAAYESNRSNANEMMLDSSLIAGSVRELVADGAAWSGTMSELL